MSVDALFRRVVENNAGLHQRYKNPHILPLVARPVLRGVFKLIDASLEPGIFRPDPELDGDDPLPSLVARSMDAVGAEDEIGVSLAKLARLGFFSITSTNCIVVNTAAARRAAGPTSSARTEANRLNGMKGGRPRADGSAPRRSDQRREQGSLMLPIEGGVGPAAYGDPVVGENLALQLRSQIRLADWSDAQTQITQVETENPIETQTQQLSQSVSGLGSVGSSHITEEEEDRVSSTAEEEEKDLSNPPPPPPPRASEPAIQTQTQTQEPEPKPISPLSRIAIDLADRESQKWSWPAEVAKTAPVVFQAIFDAKWTLDQFEQVATGPGQPRGPGFYRKALVAKFGAPGQRALESPSAPADTSNYPADLAGRWVEPLTKVRERIKQSFAAAEYRSWLTHLRFIAFDDGELTVWSPTGFQCDHVRNNHAPRLARMIETICPEVKRLVFVSGIKQLAKAS